MIKDKKTDVKKASLTTVELEALENGHKNVDIFFTVLAVVSCLFLIALVIFH
ncbi:MAG TPA: hypothetical protein VK949_08190 [Methylotenera sp.]|nr:hypothetical protein [Methylotenera sp.]